MLIAIALLALAAAENLSLGSRLPPDTGFYFASPVAADHEAVVVWNEGGGQRERRQTIIRSGRWLREENSADGRSSIVHSDFAVGISISYALEAGRYRSMLIRRYSSTDSYHRYRRLPTGVRERVLGEECEIWRTTRVGAREGEEPVLLSCDTADGIQLWSRAASTSGYVIEQSRTISFRRRPVAAEEIRPPADLLRWPYWRDLPAEGSPVAWPAHRPRNYELRLQGSGAGERERVLRSHGDWTYTSRILSGSVRHFRIDNRIVAIGYEAEADGRAVSLAIHRLPPEQVAADDLPRQVRVDPPESERVIGETCYWSQHGSSEGIVITSGHHRECVTADGLPLRVISHHRVLLADLTATRLVRRRPRLSALMPPVEAFDWALWGVTPRD